MHSPHTTQTRGLAVGSNKESLQVTTEASAWAERDSVTEVALTLASRPQSTLPLYYLPHSVVFHVASHDSTAALAFWMLKPKTLEPSQAPTHSQ